MRKEAEIRRLKDRILKHSLEIEKDKKKLKNLTAGNQYSLEENYKKAGIYANK